MVKQRSFLRNIEADGLLELFFIAAVLTVLTVRFALHLTGYPHLGGARLHVAHVLWGGLFMALAVLALLAFLTRPAHRLAALVGGVGFGLFIDEVGKFLTRDTNYFFLPAVSVIYVTLVLIFIAVRTVRTIRPFSRTEYLLNAIAAMQEVALQDLDREEQRRALRYLEACDPDDPLVAPLLKMIEHTATAAPPPPGLLTRLRHRSRRLYHRLAERPRFHRAIVAFFAVEQGIGLIFLLAALVFREGNLQEILGARFIRVFSRRPETFSVAFTGEAISTLLSVALALLGFARIRRSRLGALRMFERSVLVSILLTEPFVFYREQFWALVGLAFNVVVLLALRYMIARERAREPAGQPQRV